MLQHSLRRSLCPILPFPNLHSALNTQKPLPSLGRYPLPHILGKGGEISRPLSLPRLSQKMNAEKPGEVQPLQQHFHAQVESLELRRRRYYGLMQTALRRLNIIKPLTTNVGLGFKLPKKISLLTSLQRDKTLSKPGGKREKIVLFISWTDLCSPNSIARCH